MTNEISPLLEGAAAQARPVVHGVRDEQMGLPTPCSEYDVSALLNHLFHVVVSFQSLAAGGSADFSSTPDYLDGGRADWRARFDEETARLVEAWSAPGALEGTSQGMGLPQRTVGGMVLGDLTVHAWDLARATDQDFHPYGPGLPELLEGWRELAPMGRKMKVFGEPFPVSGNASPFDELLALSGRDPDWRPPAPS
ncbi:TIGR03086 family metal-binding protein [Streptomyces sp. WMMB 322]|uniref:TIGR03086 family metal-binding protein n=1 Tax=Streptomyces sp. WMMB 322 TaxID=1286821 RepID=UPI0006E20D2F|nr:TIGR03086 family metal-binding protein [Streptomyces sp. WMMB 322]SCK57544.1 TIGR03086 family protein [Streptomyces sp. WMMB 322]